MTVFIVYFHIQKDKTEITLLFLQWFLFYFSVTGCVCVCVCVCVYGVAALRTRTTFIHTIMILALGGERKIAIEREIYNRFMKIDKKRERDAIHSLTHTQPHKHISCLVFFFFLGRSSSSSMSGCWVFLYKPPQLKKKR